MGIGQIPILSYTGISRIHLFGVFWSSKTGIQQRVFFWTSPRLSDPPPFFFFYFCTFAHSWVLLFGRTNKGKKRTYGKTNVCAYVLVFACLFVCLYEWTYSQFSLFPVMDPQISWDAFQNHLKIPFGKRWSGDGDRWMHITIPNTSLPNTFVQSHYRSYEAGFTKRPLS